jgi:Glycosyl hydrolases family 8
MKQPVLLALLAGLASACASAEGPPEPAPAPSPAPAVAPRFPFPRHTAYTAGTIRPSRRSQAQQDDDVRALYARWKGRYLAGAGATSDGAPLYRVSFGSSNPGRTVSEGQGYGMVIVALLAGHEADARTIFDGLWRFALAHPSRIDPRLMGWQVPENGPTDSAFDGDADIALGLVLADQQWGSGGPVDYAAAARRVITGILESTIGPQSRLPMLGDWTAPGGSPHNQYTPRTSDLMPGHFRAFGRFTGESVWGEIRAQSQATVALLQARYAPRTGLLPDFAVPRSTTDHRPQPAPPGFLEGPNDGAYWYNACRDPWRLATDALQSGDPASLEPARRLARFIRDATGGNPGRIATGYRLDGTPIRPDFTTAFAAPFAVAAMTDASLQTWLDDAYDAVRNHPEDYYEDSLALQALLVLTGNYWTP